MDGCRGFCEGRAVFHVSPYAEDVRDKTLTPLVGHEVTVRSSGPEATVSGSEATVLSGPRGHRS